LGAILCIERSNCRLSRDRPSQAFTPNQMMSNVTKYLKL
jgi:hypothetical protein